MTMSREQVQDLAEKMAFQMGGHGVLLDEILLYMSTQSLQDMLLDIANTWDLDLEDVDD